MTFKKKTTKKTIQAFIQLCHSLPQGIDQIKTPIDRDDYL